MRFYQPFAHALALICSTLLWTGFAGAQIPDDERVDEPQQVTGAFRLRNGDVRYDADNPTDANPTFTNPSEYTPADAPAQAGGASRRLDEGVIRSEDLSAALYELLLDPALQARLAVTPLGRNVVPADLQDKAFENYVDLRLLGDAWARLDASRLVDAAMQLAEGERILLRSHRTISAADALTLAAKTAIDQRDTATLERLQRIAKLRDDKGLAALLASTSKLASASRDGQDEDDEVIIHAERTGPIEYALLHACCRDLQRAQLAGDGKTLQVLEQVIPHLPLASDEQKQQLLKSAKQPVPEADAKTLQLQKSLHLLAGVSRQCDLADKSCFPATGGGFDQLNGASRCDHPGCGRYLATGEILAEMEAAPRATPEQRVAASVALEKLQAASRQCDMKMENCFP